MQKSQDSTTTETDNTLHLNGLDFENLEAPQVPTKHAEDLKAQEKFSGDMFYGSLPGIKKMRKADKEAEKFNDLTLEQRLDPEINHDRATQDDDNAVLPPDDLVPPT